MDPIILTLAVALARLACVPGCVVFGVAIPGEEIVVSPRVALFRLAGTNLFRLPVEVHAEGTGGYAVFANSGMPAFTFNVTN